MGGRLSIRLWDQRRAGTPRALVDAGGARSPLTSARSITGSSPRTYDWVRLATFLLVFLGTLARVRQWAGDRSLWLDEALIADNIPHRSFVELAREPLLHNQAAPPLWLWCEKAATLVFGVSERSLRLFPLVCGLAMLPLVVLLSRRVLSRRATLLPTAVVCLHPGLIYYSNEVKPYSSDVLAVAVVGLVVLSLDEDEPGYARRLTVLANVGANLVWFSYPAVFALGGATCLLLARPLARRDVRTLLRGAMRLAPWAASFFVEYVLLLRHYAANAPLKQYWRSTYPAGVSTVPEWFLRRVSELADDPLRLVPPVLSLVALAWALVLAGREQDRRMALLWAPVALALCAAGASVYPFAGRLALWTIPIVAVTLGRTLTRASPTENRRRALLLQLVVVAPTLALMTAGLSLTVTAEPREELRPLLKQIETMRAPDEALYMSLATRPAFYFYASRRDQPRDGIIFLSPSQAASHQCDDQATVLPAAAGQDSFWLVSSHKLANTTTAVSFEPILQRIRSNFVEDVHLHESGADAWRFRRGPSQERTGSSAEPGPFVRCLLVRDVRASR